MRYWHRFVRSWPSSNIKYEELARLAYEAHYSDDLGLCCPPNGWNYAPSFVEIRYRLNFSSWLGDALQFLLQSNLNGALLADS